MDWLGNNVKTFKVKGITIIANRNNGMVIGLDREGEEVVDLLKSNLIEISSLSDNQKELYKVLEENDFLKSCYKEVTSSPTYRGGGFPNLGGFGSRSIVPTC